MAERALELARRLRQFNDEVIGFVERCSDEIWIRQCAEEWSVGVVARHIGAGHYRVIGLARMIANGEPLPPLTAEQIVQMANDHAREHAGCTKSQVLEILRSQGEAAAAFAARLTDAELDRTGFLAMLDRDVSTLQFLEMVIIHSGGEHLVSMKAAAR
jgi:hypothetical protein